MAIFRKNAEEAVEEIKKQAKVIRRTRRKKLNRDVDMVRSHLRDELEKEIRDTNRTKLTELQAVLAKVTKERNHLLCYSRDNCLRNRNCRVSELLSELGERSEPGQGSLQEWDQESTTDGLDEKTQERLSRLSPHYYQKRDIERDLRSAMTRRSAEYNAWNKRQEKRIAQQKREIAKLTKQVESLTSERDRYKLMSVI
jgi:hypothetical protein